MQRAALRLRRWSSARYAFQKNGVQRRGMAFNINPELNLETITRLTDLRAPHTWYAAARGIKRRIIAHLGPTNSGKTHHAIQALKGAESGLYAGPLRLLAWEQFDRMNSVEGVPCSLLTGQEKQPTPGARHVSCTMEMVDVSAPVRVGVLDEIQMISDEERGWAWTRALMGLPAAEVHVCGDASALPLLRSIVHSMGEELEVRQYERLSPLQLEPKLVQSWKQVQPGDCIVAFSRKKLFEIKQDVERSTRLRCAMVYGALPPAVRREQARAFNDPGSDTSVLVATDAVGMGLNLAIRRVVFSAVSKFDGVQTRSLTVSEAKQIAGRAGRFSSEHPTGYVAARTSSDKKLLGNALAGHSIQNTSAGLSPSSDQLELFAASIATPDQRRRLVVERADRELGRAWRDFEEVQWRRLQAKQYAQGSRGAHSSDDDVSGAELDLTAPCTPRQRHASDLAAALLGKVADNLGAAAAQAGAAPQLAEQYRQRLAILQRGVEALPLSGGGQGSGEQDSGGGFVSLFAGLHGGQGDFTSGLAEAQLRSLVHDVSSRGGGGAGALSSDSDSDSDDAEGDSESSDDDTYTAPASARGAAGAVFPGAAAQAKQAAEGGEYASQFDDEPGANNHASLAGSSGDDDDDYLDDWSDEGGSTSVEGGGQEEPHSAAATAMSAAAATLAEQLETLAAAPSTSFEPAVAEADFGMDVPKARAITFSQLLALYLEFAKVDESKFFMCDHSDATRVAAAIDHVPLPLAARFIFCRAPVDVDDKVALTALQRYARGFAADQPVRIALRVPDRPPRNTWELKALEGAHGVFDMYLWLCQRFPRHFTQQRKAERAVAAIEGMIQHALSHLGAEGRAVVKAARAKRGGARGAHVGQSALTEDLVQRVREALEGGGATPQQQVERLKQVRQELQAAVHATQGGSAFAAPSDASRSAARDARRARDRQLEVLRKALKRTKKALKSAKSAVA